MRKTIEHLKKQPEHIQKRVALGVAALVTLAIFGIWVTSLPLVRNKDGEVFVDTTPSKSPIVGLTDSLASSFEGIKSVLMSNPFSSSNSNPSSVKKSSSTNASRNYSGGSGGYIDDTSGLKVKIGN